MAHPTGTRPFSRFEWMLAARYMRPRRRRSSGLLIAFLSLLGIMIGVAALIIVMAVMNGFREQLIDKILGLNGHLIIQPMDSKLTDYADVAARIAKVPGVAVGDPAGRRPGAGERRLDLERRPRPRHPRRRPAATCAASPRT